MSPHPSFSQSDPRPDILHDPEHKRFELPCANGDRAVLEYTVGKNHVVFHHTHVPESMRGAGIAAMLTRAALEEARKLGWKIVPACSYTAAFISRHPEFGDLLHQS